jgi:hypothetical protein
MINSVRNTVLSILNKNNYGYISPSDFNLFAKQAQMDIFEDYFYQYNYQLLKENARQSGTGYADIRKGYEEVIEMFSETKYLTHSTNNTFFLPAQIYTGDDYYLINKVLGYQTTAATGTVTTVTAGQLVDTNVNFQSLGVQVGDIVFNYRPTAPTFATVTNVVNATTLDLSSGIFDNVLDLGASYAVFKPKQNELEKVTLSKITMLNNSMLTAPNRLFPAYSQEGGLLTAYPSDLTEGILCQYIRYPKDPKWTYVQLTNGEPSFDSSQSDYQDFELPNDDEPSLIMKILQYAGMSIREIQAVQFGQAQDQEDSQEER